MAKCITCGAELNPERAKKYNYCMLPDCQRKNLRPLTMVAVGVNKAAEQYLLLDERTKDDLASGKYHDQRRGSYGTTRDGSSPAGGRAPAAGRGRAGGRRAAGHPAAGGGTADGSAVEGSAAEGRAAGRTAPAAQRRSPAPPRRAPSVPQRMPWSRSQQKLALLYNEQGLRPEEIAAKIGLSRYLVTKIILAARNGGKI